MHVYVLAKDGQPLMPTARCGKVRRLLKSGKAITIKRCPFTIQLQYEPATRITQDITLGVDAGSKHIGLSATTKSRVLYEEDIAIRTDVTKLIATRRECRQSRRSRKTRYRKPRFNNRKNRKGKLAPSIEQKVGTHMHAVKRVSDILPIAKIIIEVASFDIQKIKNPSISGKEYQEGEQLNFWNVREYVLFRDNHTCQCCKGRSGDKTLSTHHIESRKTGGDAPNNLVTLCKTCHTGYHQGKVKLPEKIRRGMPFRHAAFMGIMRWSFYNRLKEIYPNVSLTYGYITKNTRIRNNLPKTHCMDARCISDNPLAESDGVIYFTKKTRCHNRQIHKMKFLKGGKRKANQCPHKVFGFCLNDKVLLQGQVCFIKARRKTGYFTLAKLDGTKVKETSYKKLKLLEKNSNYITDMVFLPKQAMRYPRHE